MSATAAVEIMAGKMTRARREGDETDRPSTVAGRGNVPDDNIIVINAFFFFYETKIHALVNVKRGMRVCVYTHVCVCSGRSPLLRTGPATRRHPETGRTVPRNGVLYFFYFFKLLSLFSRAKSGGRRRQHSPPTVVGQRIATETETRPAAAAA